jgi:hypothetical protein
VEQLTYRLDQFEGPLDLLLTLIQKNKVSITDIPIALICDQYIEYLKEAEDAEIQVLILSAYITPEIYSILQRMVRHCFIILLTEQYDLINSIYIGGDAYREGWEMGKLYLSAADEDGNPIVTFGTAIIPTHLIKDAGLDTFDVEALKAAGYKVLEIDADRTMANTLRDEEGEVYGYNIRAAITNIGKWGEERYNWKYSAITYITYKNARSGEIETVYGAYNEAENSRCITEIAVKAYADVKDVDDEGYDPSVYIYACEGGYSPYTTAQRATIKSFADKYDAALVK